MKKLILSILFILCLSSQASALGPMMLLSGSSGACEFASEDFTTYAITDAGDDIDAPTTTQITWTALPNDVQSMATKDRTAAYFAGDFTSRFTIQWTTPTSNHAIVFFWAVANKATGLKVIDTGTAEDDDFIGLRMYMPLQVEQFDLIECVDGAVSTKDSYIGGTVDTDYYVTITRVTNTITAYICTTAYCVDGGNLQDSITFEQSEANDYRYTYALDSWNNGQSSNNTTGYIKNMEDKLCID